MIPLSILFRLREKFNKHAKYWQENPKELRQEVNKIKKKTFIKLGYERRKKK